MFDATIRKSFLVAGLFAVVTQAGAAAAAEAIATSLASAPHWTPSWQPSRTAIRRP
jgi:hypothetical protein